MDTCGGPSRSSPGSRCRCTNGYAFSCPLFLGYTAYSGHGANPTGCRDYYRHAMSWSVTVTTGIVIGTDALFIIDGSWRRAATGLAAGTHLEESLGVTQRWLWLLMENWRPSHGAATMLCITSGNTLSNIQ